VAGVAGVVALRLEDMLAGVPFAVLLVGLPVAGGLAAQWLVARRDRPDGPDREPEVPLEWVGIDRPFTREDVAALDRELGLETVEAGA
jgi:hypothetical protein